MRWRQDRHTGEFIPIDERARVHDAGRVAIHGVFDPFVSPVDGSEIHTAKQLREHNKRNNVVCSEEFSPEHYERKAKERADFYEGRHSREESFKRKQEIYETWVAEERKHGY